MDDRFLEGDQQEGKPADNHLISADSATPPIARHPLPACIPKGKAGSDHDKNDDRHALVARVRAILPGNLDVDADKGTIHFFSSPRQVCGLILPVLTLRRPATGDGYAILFEFLDLSGEVKSTVCEMAELASGSGFARRLTGLGFPIHISVKEFLEFLREWTARSQPLLGWRLDRAGWVSLPECDRIFVQPDGRVVAKDVDAVPDLALLHASPLLRAGSVQGWSSGVAAYAEGNPLLMAALSASFAGPLLDLMRMETVGLNFYGGPGSGKSLLLQSAQSAWDSPASTTFWSQLPGQLKDLKARRNDGLMTIEAFNTHPSSKEMNALASFATDSSFENRETGHRLVILMSSEAPRDEIFRHKRHPQAEALKVRFLDIPVDGGVHGAFDDLHGYPDAASFVTALRDEIRGHHGHAAGVFIEWLVQNRECAEKMLHRDMDRFVMQELELRQESSTGHLAQQLKRLGLIGAAGELAIRAGVVPWKENAAMKAAHDIAAFCQTAEQQKSGDPAHRILIKAIKTHRWKLGWLGGTPVEKEDQTGWQDDQFYYLTGHMLEDARSCHLDALKEAGILRAGGEKRSYQARMDKTQHSGRPRVYRISKRALADVVPDMSIEFSLKERILNFFLPEDNED